MTTSAPSIPMAETALQREHVLFKELFARLGNALLNRIFDLRPEKAARRMWYLVVLLFVSVFLVSLRFYPLDLWAKYIRDIFLYYLNPNYPAIYIGNPLINFANFFYYVFTEPRIFQYFPVFLAPFFIALQCAALYLADIFELEHVSVARTFIWGVALVGSEETIRISQGHVSDQHRQSPTYLIGGPGKVIVDFDSVALFEKPDGTPRVIGPTGKNLGGRVTLEGFERYRQAIDLRDHFVLLRDQDENSRSIRSRSLDGIPVSAVDVQIIFSIFRDNKKPTEEGQFPYNKKAVEQLLYSSTSKVTPHLFQPSTYAFIWEYIAPGMVRSELSKFMSERNLTEYLASFGIPEVEKAKNREAAIAEEKRQILPNFESAPVARPVPPPPPFTPRHQLSDLFNQFTNEFAKNANKRGVQFSWIGLGTWETPKEIVADAHIEAWKLTKENVMRGDVGSIESKGGETGLRAILAMIQNVPVEIFQGLKHERKLAIESLLKEYQRQLKDIYESLIKNNRRIPPTLVAALVYVFQILTPSHIVSPSSPPPDTEREKQLYDKLMRKTGSHEVIEKLIVLERRFFPTASREELLEEINRNWDLDIDGNWQS